MPVLDASALVAIYLPADDHHEVIVRWMQSTTGRFHLPAIGLAELAGALSRGASLTHATVQAAVRDLTLENAITLHPVDRPLAHRAANIADNHRLRGCDAIYVALAQQLDDVLVTFDAEQLERASAAVRVLRPA